MKTPRELILDQHRDAGAKLQSIRAEDLAALARPAIILEKSEPRPFFLFSLARNFWEESILPWRRVWVGMAAAWLGIIAFHFGSLQNGSVAMAREPASDSRVVLAAWRERRQMLAQLLESPAPGAAAVRKIPGPSSSLSAETTVV